MKEDRSRKGKHRNRSKSKEKKADRSQSRHKKDKKKDKSAKKEKGSKDDKELSEVSDAASEPVLTKDPEDKDPATKDPKADDKEDLSDVSEHDIEETREVRLKDPSMSPINSDQSESYEKAATLEGLNPETISPEEDFTSLSEEEEGEIKNYERRKKLNKRKKEKNDHEIINTIYFPLVFKD